MVLGWHRLLQVDLAEGAKGVQFELRYKVSDLLNFLVERVLAFQLFQIFQKDRVVEQGALDFWLEHSQELRLFVQMLFDQITELKDTFVFEPVNFFQFL